MTIDHGEQQTGRVKSDQERTPTMAELDARASAVYATDKPQEQSGVSLHNRQVNPTNEGHLAGGDDKVKDTTNPFQDTARDTAMGEQPAGSGVDSYAKSMIERQGVEPMLTNPLTANAPQQQAHEAAISQDVGGPSASQPMSPGMDGLTLATSHAAQEGSLKPLSDLKGLDEAVSGLRCGMQGGGQSLLAGGAVKAPAEGQVMSPSHHSMQGAKNADFMAERSAQRNQAFAQDMPQK